MNQIRTVLFDLGGVIITLDPQQAVDRFKALGLADAEKRLDSYTQSGIFGDLEHGLITDEDFRREFSLLVGREVSHEACAHAWQGYALEVPKRNLEALKQLKEQGYRVLLLSNTNPYMMEWAESPAFDGEGHPVSYYFAAPAQRLPLRRRQKKRRLFLTQRTQRTQRALWKCLRV